MSTKSALILVRRWIWSTAGKGDLILRWIIQFPKIASYHLRVPANLTGLYIQVAVEVEHLDKYLGTKMGGIEGELSTPAPVGPLALGNTEPKAKEVTEPLDNNQAPEGQLARLNRGVCS